MVKVCGVTRKDDLAAAVELGANAIGFNRFPQSPRYVDREVLSQLGGMLPGHVARVAVVVDPQSPEMTADSRVLPNVVMQIHVSTQAKPPAPTPQPVILAGGVARPEDREDLIHFARLSRAAGLDVFAVLVDAKVPGLHGGTGQRAAWEHLLSWPDDLPLILAGGLTPENVATAIATVRPWAVDVASGIESAPGHKDHRKMADFIAAAHAAFAQLGRQPTSWAERVANDSPRQA